MVESGVSPRDLRRKLSSVAHELCDWSKFLNSHMPGSSHLQYKANVPCLHWCKEMSTHLLTGLPGMVGFP